MEFDSHRSAAVAGAVSLINELVPGHRRGRPYPGPPADALVAATERALAGSWDPAPDLDEAAEAARWCRRLHEVVRDVAEGDLDAACAELNAVLREAGAVPTLVRHDTEPWHLHFHTGDAPWARGWAAGMATSLAIIIGNPVIDRLGICTAPACDRVYVDTSRNGTKRFCGTACQNRVKAAAFRRRAAGLE